MELSIVFHLLGMVFWVGGLLFLSRFARVLIAETSCQDELAQSLRRSWCFFVLPGCIVSLLTGLHQWFAGGFQFYLQQGWFHGKLLFVVLLFIVTGMMALQMQRLKKTELLQRKALGIIHGVSGLALIVIIFLVIFGRM